MTLHLNYIVFTNCCCWNAGTTQKWFNMASLYHTSTSGKTLALHYPPASHSPLCWSLLSQKARAGGPVLAEAASVHMHMAPSYTAQRYILPTPCMQTHTDMHTHPPHPHMYNNKWMHTPIHPYIHIQIHPYTHTNTPIHTHTNTPIHINTYIHPYTHIQIHPHPHTFTYTCVHVHTHTHKSGVTLVTKECTPL